jgi:hypothetical protein
MNGAGLGIMRFVSWKSLVVLGLFAGLLASTSGTAGAYTDNAIGNRAPLTNSGNYSNGGSNFTPVTGVGNGSFDGEVSFMKVYVPLGQSADIKITQCQAKDLNSPDVTYKLFGLNAQETVGGTFNFDARSERKTNCSNVNWTIGPNAGVESGIPGHERYRVFGVVAEINNRVGSNERYFRVETSAGKVGFARPDAFGIFVGSGEKYFAIYNGSGTWDYSIMFAPRCNIEKGNSQRTIRIFDADNGIYQENMRAVLERADRDTKGPIKWRTIENWSSNQVQGGARGTSNTTAALNFDANKEFIYKLTIKESKYPNTIQLQIPFDQIDAERDLFDGQGCGDWELEGTSWVQNNSGIWTKTTQRLRHRRRNPIKTLTIGV